MEKRSNSISTGRIFEFLDFIAGEIVSVIVYWILISFVWALAEAQKNFWSGIIIGLVCVGLFSKYVFNKEKENKFSLKYTMFTRVVMYLIAILLITLIFGTLKISF